MSDTEFISADELIRRLARWEGSDVAQAFIRDLARGTRATGNGYTAWPGEDGYHWAKVGVDSSQP